MTVKNAKLTAFRILSIKGQSVAELRKKLTLRQFAPAEVEEAIETCIRLGYLNDVEEGRRRQERLTRKGYGPRLIAAKLKSQGLGTFKQSIAEQIKQIQTLLQKPAWKKKEKRTLIAALQRRGFDWEAVQECLRGLLQE